MKNIQSSKVVNKALNVKLMTSLIISFLLFALAITGVITSFIPKGQANLAYETKQGTTKNESVDLSAASIVTFPDNLTLKSKLTNFISFTSITFSAQKSVSNYTEMIPLAQDSDEPTTIIYAYINGTDVTFCCNQGSEYFYLPEDCSNMFNGWDGIESFTFENNAANTTNVKNMGSMFIGCDNLRDVDFGNFDTSNVTKLSVIFYGCVSLKTIDLSAFNTKNVQDMSGIFRTCSNLESVEISGFNTEKVDNMSGMFFGCSSLKSVDLSNFNTSLVDNMANMFSDCSSLTNLDLHNFDTSKVNNLASMFNGCSNLENLNISGFTITSALSTNNMFSGCSKLTSIDTSNFKTNKISYVGGMFLNCSKITSLDLSGFDLTNVTRISGISDFIKGCTSLKYLKTPYNISNSFSGISAIKLPITMYNAENSEALTELPTNSDHSYTLLDVMPLTLPTTWSLEISGTTNGIGLEVKDITSILFEYEGASSLSEYSDTNKTLSTGIKIYRKRTSGGDIAFVNSGIIYAPVNSGYLFSNTSDSSRLYSLTTISFNNFNTSNVTNMSDMFNNCKGLKSLDLSSFNTSEVTDMSNMFYGCNSLTSLDVSSFNTTNVTNMANMFLSCSELFSLDLSSFITSKVTDMNSMFDGCNSLTSLDVSNFVTSNVINMYYMFVDCSGLKSLDLSNFDTSKVTSMNFMFYKCSSLETIDLSGFDMTNVTYAYSLFDDCNSLTDIKSPINLTVDVSLSGVWYDTSNNYEIITTLPKDKVSHILTKNAPEYTLTFDAQGGTLSLDSKTIVYNQNYGELATATKVGYTFSGWYLETTYENLIEETTLVTIKANHTLYAKWMPNTDTVYKVEHWIENIGADGSVFNDTNYSLKETSNLTGTTDTNVTPNVNIYQGFTSPATQTITISADGTTVLKYYYTRNSYKLSLAKGTGIDSVLGEGTYQYEENVTINAEVSVGYTWANWTGSSVVSSKSNFFKMPANELSYTANATANTYINTLYYDANGGSNGPSAQIENVIYPNTKFTHEISKSVPTRLGYTFLGWFTTIDGDTSVGSMYVVGSDNIAENQSAAIYAHWEIVTYNISYNLNGGTSNNSQTYTIDTETFTLNNPVKADFTFVGWTGSNGENPQTVVTIEKGSTGNKEFTANWTQFQVKPTAIEGLIYNGLEQIGIANYSSNGFDLVSGQINATSAGNYTATFKLKSGFKWQDNTTQDVVVNFTISKKDLTITAENKNMTYGENVPTYSFALSGFVNNETVNNLTGNIIYTIKNSSNETVEITTISNVGVYTIIPSGFSSNNYEITYIYGTLSVTKAQLNAPTNLLVNSYGIVTFENVVGATSYEISVNNSLFTTCVSGNDYNDLITAVAGEREVKVRAVSSNENYISTSDVISVKVMVYTLTLNKKVDKNITNIYSKNYIKGRTVDLSIKIGRDDKFIEWIVDENGDKPLDSKSNNTSLTITKDTIITANVELVSNTTVTMIAMIGSIVALIMIIAIVTIIVIKNKKKKKKARINRIILNKFK